MKGVSAVIAIILILMIVVALAALAWTWFSGIFSSLTETAETSVTSTTTQMAQNFVIENAYCYTAGSELQFTVRNTGTGDIDEAGVAAYVGGTKKIVVATNPGTDIIPGLSEDYKSSYDCSSEVGEILRITIATGLAKTRTIE